MLFSFFMLTVLLQSCETSKNIPYFHDFADTARPALVKTVPFSYPKIQPDDLLMIVIQTLNQEANTLFASANVPVASVGSNTAGMSGNQYVSGYLVDKDGNVNIPVVGKTHLAGLTTEEAKDTITARVEKFYNNPTVEVRYNNFKITIMGEVERPATYTVPNEKVTILDAIGMAGDLTIYGRRENVLLIRDSGGSRELVRLDLNSKNIIGSPYFYMKQNDVVYVEPSDSKVKSLDNYRLRNYTIAAAALSVLIVLATRLK